MVPLAVYTMEAVLDFQAMDSDCHVKKGETLTLVLGNQKLCLVHRKDDLPFVVPMAYVCLRTQPEEKPGPGSFSKFLLRDRKAGSSSRSRQQYPLSTSFNLESSVRPQFAIVTDSFSATSQNEVDLLRDTSVLILNADPQSLYWFGITQFGAYGLLPKNNVSVITQKGTPSLQQGCRLTAYTRRAYKSDEHDEVAVMKGWNLEIIGMPEMWRWQVRLSKGERKVGLLPVHVIGEVSVITSPNDGAPSEIMRPTPVVQGRVSTSVRPPSMLDPTDLDPRSLSLMVRSSEASVKRRLSRPLPRIPVTTQTNTQSMTWSETQSMTLSATQSLNDLDRSTEAPPNIYVNDQRNRFSFYSHESKGPHKLVSDEAVVPMGLRGISHPPTEEDDESHEGYDYVDDGEDVTDHRLDVIERLLWEMRQERKTRKRSSEGKRWEARHWKRTVDSVRQVLDDAQAISRSQEDLQDLGCDYDEPDYFRKRAAEIHQMFPDGDSKDAAATYDYPTAPCHEPTYAPGHLQEDGRIGSGAVPRNKPPATGRRASLGPPGTAPARTAPYCTTGRRASLGATANAMLNTVLHGTALPNTALPGTAQPGTALPGTAPSSAVSWLEKSIAEHNEASSAHPSGPGSQPMIDTKEEDASTAGKLVIMPKRLSNLVIDAAVSIVCPPDVKRPRLHWKPILVKLGLQEDRARGIERSELSFREQWREALVAWRDRMGHEATTSIFLREMKATGHKDLYQKIVSKCTLPVKPAQRSCGTAESV